MIIVKKKRKKAPVSDGGPVQFANDYVQQQQQHSTSPAPFSAATGSVGAHDLSCGGMQSDVSAVCSPKHVVCKSVLGWQQPKSDWYY